MQDVTNKITNFLEEANTECEMLIGKSEQEIRDFIEDYQKRFDISINGDIYATFGEYLYNALGKKINPQPKNKILRVWLDNNKDKLFNSVKKDNGVYENVPITDDDAIFLKIADINRQDNYWESNNRKSYYISHATCGKKFGMGYVTEGKTVRSVDIPSEVLFFYLTQDHVDLITNKQKRACAQEFLQFRDAYMSIRDDLNKHQVLDTKIKCKSAVIKQIAVSNAIRKSGYYGDQIEKKYLIHDSTCDADVNIVEIQLLNVGIRRRKDSISQLINIKNRDLKDDFKNVSKSEPHAILITAFTNNANNEMTYRGSIQLNEEKSLIPLDVEKIKSTKKVCWFGNEVGASYSYRDFSPATANCTNLSNAQSFILDWKLILNNKSILNAIDQRIKFFENASKTLHYLKKKHAALVFIHGVF